MKSIIVVVRNNAIKRLKSFSDDGYLYNYIVNNGTELDENNIFRNPDKLIKLNNYCVFLKNKITKGDLLVWKQTNYNLKKKLASFCALIIDDQTGEYTVYNSLKDTITELEINGETDSENVKEKMLMKWREDIWES